MAVTALAKHKVSIAQACQAFGVSETCYRYGPKLHCENERIADLLIGLTNAPKDLGLWPVLLVPAQRERDEGMNAMGSNECPNAGTTSGSTGFIGNWS